MYTYVAHVCLDTYVYTSKYTYIVQMSDPTVNATPEVNWVRFMRQNCELREKLANCDDSRSR
jgi:hypothetical protein